METSDGNSKGNLKGNKEKDKKHSEGNFHECSKGNPEEYP